MELVYESMLGTDPIYLGPTPWIRSSSLRMRRIYIGLGRTLHVNLDPGQQMRLAKVKAVASTPLRDGLTALVTPDRAIRMPCHRRCQRFFPDSVRSSWFSTKKVNSFTLDAWGLASPSNTQRFEETSE